MDRFKGKSAAKRHISWEKIWFPVFFSHYPILWISSHRFWTTPPACSPRVEDYDFIFWIDADAVFYDQSKRIEEALNLEAGDAASFEYLDVFG